MTRTGEQLFLGKTEQNRNEPDLTRQKGAVNMMNRNDLACAVMSDAWALYRATVAEDPTAANKVTFALCLRFAWERQPDRYAEKVRAAWNSMGAARQLETCRKMAYTAARTYAAKTGAYVDFSRIDPEDLGAETWIIMQERLDTLEAIQAGRNRKGRLPLPLGVLMHRAAAEALRRAIRQENANAGDNYETAAACLASCADTAETSALLDALNSVTDPEQRAVLELLVQGLTVREIANSVGLSRSSVQRRIDAIRSTILDRLVA